MEYWEFLIQREGDRGWRTIETGNLQLMEGKYRIVANSDLRNTQIQIRATYQTADTIPQRRSQSRTKTTNPRGLLAVVPFTQLQAGIWQFVCSSTSDGQASWQRILKLRVLPRIPQPAPVNSIQPQVERDESVSGFPQMTARQNRAEHNFGPKIEDKISPQQLTQTNPVQVFPPEEDRFDLPTPTKPIIPISNVGEQVNWAEGLDRLLEQLERESLQTPSPAVRSRVPGSIQITTIFDSPSQLINLNRSTFSGLLPGHRLTISGTCNLQKLSTNLIQSVKIDKLSICLRHPQTSEIIFAIEQSLPAQLDTFTFSGDLDLPMQPQTALMIGEVNLYDKHHIQLGSRGFTVSLSLDPLDAELSLFQSSEQQQDTTAELLDRLTAELQLETVTMGTRRPMLHGTPSKIRSLNSPQLLTNPPTYPSESLFTHPDIVPVPSSTSQSSNPHSSSHTLDITGDLEIDFALSSFGDGHESHNYENLEIVVDD